MPNETWPHSVREVSVTIFRRLGWPGGARES
jgi:hypothetical protein